MNNNMFNLNHKFDYYLMNNYENNFDNNEWNNDNNIKGYYAKSNDELINIIKDIAKEGEMVSVGGSITLFETNVIDLLRSGRYNFLDRYEVI